MRGFLRPQIPEVAHLASRIPPNREYLARLIHNVGWEAEVLGDAG
jgi:hypothetical protein